MSYCAHAYTLHNLRFKCAVKRLHGVLLAEVPNKVVNDFIKECRILSSLHHPNIVQFVGVNEKGQSIVMEYLHASLGDYVDEKIRTRKGFCILPIRHKHRILYDVALGLQYLHERMKPIVHRDLTANNVLLTDDLRAKIADLGQAVIKCDHKQYMTQAAGTWCYMPPEALKCNPRCDDSIDIFSFGVLILHSISEEWPIPSEVKIINPLSGDVIVSKSEFERRAKYVEKIKTLTPLTSLVKECLHDSGMHRPPVISVIARLASAIAQDINVPVEEFRDSDKALVVHYTNNVLNRKNHDLKITFAKQSSQGNKLCVIVRSPVSLGFTGTYCRTIPFSSKLSCPVDIAITLERCIYVCDYDGYKGVHRYNMNSGTEVMMVPAATVGEGSLKKKIPLHKCWYPRGIATDDNGSIYLSDTYSHRVLKFSLPSDVPIVVGEMLAPGPSPNQFNHPSGIIVNRELVYVCDTENHQVRILDSNLNYLHQLHCLDMCPIDIDFDVNGNMYVLDCSNKNIRVFENSSHRITPPHIIHLKDSQHHKLQAPTGICIDANGFIYITDKQKHGVLVLNSAGKFKMFFGTKGSSEGEFNIPCGIAVDTQGHVYVCDSGNRRVQVFL